MPEEIKPSKKISFRYKISPNYAVYSVSGVHGGLNSQGNIIVNLFNERAPIPRRVTFELTDQGTLPPVPIEKESEEALIRDVIFGIAIEPSSARSIGEWLIKQADEHQERLKKIKSKSN